MTIGGYYIEQFTASSANIHLFKSEIFDKISELLANVSWLITACRITEYSEKVWVELTTIYSKMQTWSIGNDLQFYVELNSKYEKIDDSNLQKTVNLLYVD